MYLKLLLKKIPLVDYRCAVPGSITAQLSILFYDFLLPTEGLKWDGLTSTDYVYCKHEPK